MLELQDANPFRVRAYRNAARTIASLPYSIIDLVENDKDLTELPGIGKDLADKIKKICRTGTLKFLIKLENEERGSLHELMRIPGLGPKKVKALHQTLGIETLQELTEAAQQEKIGTVEGFGKKAKSISSKSSNASRSEAAEPPTPIAQQFAVTLIKYLKPQQGPKQVKIARCFRHCRETVENLDILASCKRGTDLITHFVHYEEVDDVISKGKADQR